MKQRSTTPVSKSSYAIRACVVAASILTLLATPFTTLPVKADRYDEQIAAIQRQINGYNAQADALKSQADSYQVELDRLSNEKAQIQAQLDISIAKEKQLSEQIAANEKKLADNKSVLGDTIADLYVDDNISPLEMLASSDNIADFVDKQSNREQVQKTVQDTITQINKLKKELEDQKRDIERVLADQQNTRDALAAKEAEQQNLVNQTRGEQAAYEALTAKSREQQSQIRQAQQAAIAAAIANSGGGTVIAAGVDGDYPWNNVNCPMVGYFSTGGANGNGGDGRGYGCRQCASYAAWRVAKETGYYPINWGNATNFPSRARAAGYATGYQARAGSLGVMHASSAGVPEGHVVWVETNPDASNQIIVSQYNYNYGAGYGMYSKMKMSANAFDEFVYIK